MRLFFNTLKCTCQLFQGSKCKCIKCIKYVEIFIFNKKLGIVSYYKGNVCLPNMECTKLHIFDTKPVEV